MIVSLSYDPVLSRVRIVGSGFDAVNSNPYFETNTTGWAPSQGTFARDTTQHHEGVASGKLTPNGVGATVSVDMNSTQAVAVEPGRDYTLSGWVLSPTGWSQVSVTVLWQDSGGATISSPAGTIVDLAVNVWTNLTDVVTAPANAAKAIMRARMAGTPAATDVLYVDEMKFGFASVTVERSSDGARWSPVRGGIEVPVVNGTVTLDDYEFDAGGHG